MKEKLEQHLQMLKHSRQLCATKFSETQSILNDLAVQIHRHDGAITEMEKLLAEENNQ